MKKQEEIWDSIDIKRKRLFKYGISILIPICVFVPFAPVRFICFFLLFLLLISRFYTWYLIKNIRVIRMDTELRVFRHEWVRVELKVENHGLLPAYMLAIGDMSGNIQVFNMKKTICTLFWKSYTFLYWEGLCSERGSFPVGPAYISGADPLGLFPFRLTAIETSRLFVYPVIRNINLKNNRGVPLGNMQSANMLYEDITRCRSLRPYHLGDETRRINWKASARFSQVYNSQSGGLLVNEYENTASYPLVIFLNADLEEYPVRKRRLYLERCIEAAASVCLKSAREKQELGIIIYSGSQNDTLVIPLSNFAYVSILEKLASLEWKKTSGDSAVPKINSAEVMQDNCRNFPFGTKYLYIGPDLGDEAYINLNSLKKHHITREYLVIDERSMPLKTPDNSLRYQIRESGREII